MKSNIELLEKLTDREIEEYFNLAHKDTMFEDECEEVSCLDSFKKGIQTAINIISGQTTTENTKSVEVIYKMKLHDKISVRIYNHGNVDVIRVASGWLYKMNISEPYIFVPFYKH